MQWLLSSVDMSLQTAIADAGREVWTRQAGGEGGGGVGYATV